MEINERNFCDSNDYCPHKRRFWFLTSKLIRPLNVQEIKNKKCYTPFWSTVLLKNMRLRTISIRNRVELNLNWRMNLACKLYIRSYIYIVILDWSCLSLQQLYISFLTTTISALLVMLSSAEPWLPFLRVKAERLLQKIKPMSKPNTEVTCVLWKLWYKTFCVVLDPHFVSVYHFGNYIYYFFSDISEELLNDGSRVRVVEFQLLLSVTPCPFFSDIVLVKYGNL